MQFFKNTVSDCNVKTTLREFKVIREEQRETKERE